MNTNQWGTFSENREYVIYNTIINPDWICVGVIRLFGFTSFYICTVTSQTTTQQQIFFHCLPTVFPQSTKGTLLQSTDNVPAIGRRYLLCCPPSMFYYMPIIMFPLSANDNFTAVCQLYFTRCRPYCHGPLQ